MKYEIRYAQKISDYPKKLILKQQQQISSEYWFQRTWNCVRHFKFIVNCNFILENDKWKNERRVNFCAKTSPITLEVMFLQRASTLQLRKNMHETEDTSVANYLSKIEYDLYREYPTLWVDFMIFLLLGFYVNSILADFKRLKTAILII